MTGSAHITLQDVHPLFQSVGTHIFPGQLRQFRLQLQAMNSNLLHPVGKDQADDTATTAQVQYPLPRLGEHKMGGQHRIHRKTVTALRLPTDKTAGKEAVCGGG